MDIICQHPYIGPADQIKIMDVWANLGDLYLMDNFLQ